MKPSKPVPKNQELEILKVVWQPGPATVREVFDDFLGSPQLDSFGPDLTLARELFQKGERDAVLEYISPCRTFRKMGGAKLDAMTEAVRSGGTF